MKKQQVLLKGTPASPGKASGTARIMMTPKEMGKMGEGDILVTPFTNPLFTPAILEASGIVTDEGGMMCHAAIIAREFGIPCVVGTHEATRVLGDGKEVVVDGDEGIVYG